MDGILAELLGERIGLDSEPSTFTRTGVKEGRRLNWVGNKGNPSYGVILPKWQVLSLHPSGDKVPARLVCEVAKLEDGTPAILLYPDPGRQDPDGDE